MENPIAKWTIRINNQGNPEQHMVTLNDMLVTCSKVEIINDINDIVPYVRLTFAMDGNVNEFNLLTDTTEYKDTVVIATAKDK